MAGRERIEYKDETKTVILYEQKILFVVILAVFGLSSQNLVDVRVAEGVLAGTDSSGVKIFKGVPFAAPPVGNLRWREPQPVEPWQGVRKATPSP